MSKRKKILIGVLISITVIILDTMQAKMLKNSPIIHIRIKNPSSSIKYIDRGILVSRYVYIDTIIPREKTKLFWEK